MDEIVSKRATMNSVGNVGLAVKRGMKYPLQSSWSLWYNADDKLWERCLHKITTFDNVIDFWALFNNIKLPSEIKNGTAYALFKDNIRPVLEDMENCEGGRWVINFSKSVSGDQIDRLWIEAVMCLIGEAFNYSEDICGAIVNIRPNVDRFAVWTSNIDKARMMSIGKTLKTNLCLEAKKISFQIHSQDRFKDGYKYAVYEINHKLK